MIEIRDPNPPIHTNTQIKNTRNANTKSSTSEIHPPFDPPEKPPSFASSLRLHLVKLKVFHRRFASTRKRISPHEKTL